MYDRTRKKDHLLSWLMSDNNWHSHYECIKLFSNQDEYRVSANEINKDGFVDFDLLTGIKILPKGRLFRQTSSYLKRSVRRDLKIIVAAVAFAGAVTSSVLGYMDQTNKNRIEKAFPVSKNKELPHSETDPFPNYHRY